MFINIVRDDLYPYFYIDEEPYASYQVEVPDDFMEKYKYVMRQFESLQDDLEEMVRKKVEKE